MPSPLGPPDTSLPALLLAWYDRHGRVLPWRVPPGGAPPPEHAYRVWVSEIMLQQVRVETVRRYFEPFVARWPTVASLAAAGLDDVLRAWSGLGRYARAHNLHACARLMVERHGGRVPEDETALRALPGIGPYTAAAIRAIAFGRSATPADGNVERVMARLHGVCEPLPKARGALHGLAAALTPAAAARPGDYAQAVMDLGATVCVPRRPRCPLCPWLEICAAREQGLTDVLPVGPTREPRRTRFGVAFWAVRRDDGAVLMRPRPIRGALGGMLEVPSTEWRPDRPWDLDAEAVATRHAPVRARWRPVPGAVRHGLSNFGVEFAVLAASLAGAAAERAGRIEGAVWVAPDALDGEALPTLTRKIARHALAATGPGAVRAGARAVGRRGRDHDRDRAAAETGAAAGRVALSSRRRDRRGRDDERREGQA